MGTIRTLFSDTDFNLTNCILWGNTVGTPPESNEIVYSTGAEPIVSYSDVQGGFAGSGNIDVDPGFVDGNGGDVHLLYTSPCRDAGDSAAVTEMFDMEGDPRIHDNAVDMGADEFHPHLYVTGDAIPEGTVEAKLVGYPGSTQNGLLIGSGVLASPMQLVWGDFYLEEPWFYIGSLGNIPADGVLAIPATLPSIAAPYEIPVQALIGWELSNLFVLDVN